MLNYKKIVVVSTLSWLVAGLAHAECELVFPASTPVQDFVVHDDGTVTHSKTGLMWKVCPEGFDWSGGATCSAEGAAYTWQESLQQVSAINIGGGYAGYSDWRLPNIKELRSIVEDQCRDPALNSGIFHAGVLESVYGAFWSSTPSIQNTGYGQESAYYIDFRSGMATAYPRDNLGQVRLVRDAQSGGVFGIPGEEEYGISTGGNGGGGGGPSTQEGDRDS